MQKTRSSLGLWTLTALVAGNMIGSGIFLLPSTLAAFGSIGLLSWIFTCFGALALGLVFGSLGRMMPKIGGPYAYCRAGFGEFIGFQMAYNYWIALWVGNAAIAVAFTGYLSVFWPALEKDPILSFISSAGLVWLITLVNILGVRQAGILQLISTILKLLPLILIATVGLFFIKPELLTQAFNVSGESHLMAFSKAATLTLWAFIGLESATVPAANIKDPNKNIPRATILGILIASAVYILSAVAVMGMIPNNQLLHSNSPYAQAAEIILGPMGGKLVAIGAIISCLGALNGWILLQGQVPLAAAEDQVFPKLFGKVLKNRGTPALGLVLTSCLITGLLLLTLQESLMRQFTFIILLATLASLIPYLFTMATRFIFKPSDPQLKLKLGAYLITLFAMIYSFWMILGAGQSTVFCGCLLFFSGVPIYAFMKYNSKPIA